MLASCTARWKKKKTKSGFRTLLRILDWDLLCMYADMSPFFLLGLDITDIRGMFQEILSVSCDDAWAYWVSQQCQGGRENLRKSEFVLTLFRRVPLCFFPSQSLDSNYDLSIFHQLSRSLCPRWALTEHHRDLPCACFNSLDYHFYISVVWFQPSNK